MHNQYSYVTHKDSCLLQIKGNLRKRWAGRDKEREELPVESKSVLMRKMSKNVHDLSINPSVLPQDQPRQKVPVHSIRVYPETESKISGVEYLANKWENNRIEKRAAVLAQPRNQLRELPLTDNIPDPLNRKHFAPKTNQIDFSQVSTSQPGTNIGTRIAKDMHSCPYRQEEEKPEGVRMQQQSLFREGVRIGLERDRQYRLSQAKARELDGHKTQVLLERKRRSQWHISNITIS